MARTREHLILNISIENKPQIAASYKFLRTPNQLIKPKRVPKLSGANSGHKSNILDVLGIVMEPRGGTQTRKFILGI